MNLPRLKLGSAWAGARAAIAAGQLLTLLTNTPAQIQSLGLEPRQCDAWGSLLPHCILDNGAYELPTHIMLIAALLVVASGVLPAVTGPLHVYAALTIQAVLHTKDGGDQVALVLSVLMLPICLADRRIWSWRHTATMPSWTNVSLLAVRIQVAYIYAEAAISKMSQPTWQEGTAYYYWVNGFYFSPEPLIREPVLWLAALPPVTLAGSYGAIAFEAILALSMFLNARLQRRLFIPAVLFHATIGVVFGIWSFSIIMTGALCLLLLAGHEDQHPARGPLSHPQRVRLWQRTRGSDEPEPTVPVRV
ncbi:MAG TPA: hypothetical protein VNJ54_14410 [Plantibacter sp.]|uniref:hypothetical protein n=1 Tax=unclassified Plantibacter TaxID=2624265 RepID=UPI002BEB9A62|nr:hypothetical protein [Plantibacter sp.]